MAAAAHATPSFQDMNEAQLRQWVESNPGRVNDRDRHGVTPLYAAVWFRNSLPLTVWLLDEKGPDVNGTSNNGSTPLHDARSLDILLALMDRGANPTLLAHNGNTPLMIQPATGHVDNAACLLQDPRVRATVNVQNSGGGTALHWACLRGNESEAISILYLLLQARGDPALTKNATLQTPSAYLRHRNPTHYAAIALLEQAPKAEKASLLVKARRLIVVSRNAEASSYLQSRVAGGQPLPGVALAPVTAGEDEDEEGRKLRTALAFMCGVGREGMPRDVLRVVMDLLMPSWDPLRRRTHVGPAF